MLTISCLPVQAQCGQPLDETEILRRATEALVRLKSVDEGGGVSRRLGVLIEPNMILTSFQSVRDAIGIQIESTAPEGQAARLVAVDAGRSVAILLNPSPPSGLVLAPTNRLGTGDRGGAVSPRGLSPPGLQSVRIGKLEIWNGVPCVGIDPLLPPDHEGCPILNHFGEVEGIAASLEGRSGLCMVPAYWIADLQLAACMPLSDHRTRCWKCDKGAGSSAPEPREYELGSPPERRRREREERISNRVLESATIRRVTGFHWQSAPSPIRVPVTLRVDERGNVLSAVAADHPFKLPAEAAARAWKFDPRLLNLKRPIGVGTIEVALEPGSWPAPVHSDEAAAEATRQAQTVGETYPELLGKLSSDYTKTAAKADVQGVVYVCALVGEDGRVKEARILAGLAGGLNELTRRNVMKTRFRPATRYGKPVPYWVALMFSYSLR